MDIVEYTDRFFELEQKLKLFEDSLDGMPWWDAVRHDVYKTLYKRLVGIDDSAPAPMKLGIRIAHLMTRKWLQLKLWLKIRLFTYDVVVFRAPRQRKQGRRADFAIDQIIELCRGRKLVIDTFPHYYHRRQDRQASAVPRPAALDALHAEISRVYGLDVDLDEFIRCRLADFRAAHLSYLQLLKKMAPRLLLISQNGIEKGLFLAARRLGICSVEVQHGLINYVHPAYSYPPGVSYSRAGTFPDYFFAFSQFWIDTCHYPVATRLPLGNDAFFLSGQSATAAATDVLVVSADIYHGVLCAWVKKLAPLLPRRAIKYKLHPNQYAQVESIRQELGGLANVEVVTGQRTVREMLPQASVVVLIQSTVAYEALQSGKQLCLIPQLDYRTHCDLFAVPGVVITPTVAELAAAIETPPDTPSLPVFFDRFNHEMAEQLLDHLVAGKPPGDPSQRSIYTA